MTQPLGVWRADALPFDPKSFMREVRSLHTGPGLTIERFDTESPASPRFRLLTHGELAEIVAPPALVEGILFQRGFSSIVAPYDSFKSFVALDLQLCVAHGLDFCGAKTSPGLVVYQAGEGGAGLAKRVEAWRTLNGLPEIGGIRFLPQSLKLNDTRDRADFLAALKALPEQPKMVTIDTFARSMRGNENSVEDSSVYLEAVDAIREATGAHVQIVHHTGWEGTRSRGSSSIPAALDTEITLSRDGDRVTLECTKQKDCARFASITLEAVTVAESLAFRPFAVTSSKLSDAERCALRVLQGRGCMKTTEWQKETEAAGGGKSRTFYNSKKRLLALSYAKETRDGFIITDAGEQAA